MLNSSGIIDEMFLLFQVQERQGEETGNDTGDESSINSPDIKSESSKTSSPRNTKLDDDDDDDDDDDGGCELSHSRR